MDARLVALSIPLFFVLMGLEFVVLRRDPDRRYRLHDSISSLSCGVGQQVLGAFLHFIPVAAYAAIYEHARVTTVPESALTWVVLFLGVDLAYYVYHWASHRVNFFWATHAVHHQSEEYNLSTALRQSWFTATTSWLFYTPLALLGFSPAMFLVAYTLMILYQFWIHTRAVGTLGPLEWILNTPSHHRVHHGIDPKYIDKNFAGVFILWDRLFRTFRREDSEPVYGVVQPLASWNPFWANAEPFAKLWQMSRATKRLRDKLFVWIAPPEWRPADLGGRVTVPEVARATQHRYGTEASPIVNAYIVTGFLLVSATTTALLEVSTKISAFENAAIVGLVMVSLAVWAGLAERKPWATPVELVKLTATVALGAWFLRERPERTFAIPLLAVLGLGLGAWAVKCGRAAASDRSTATTPAVS